MIRAAVLGLLFLLAAAASAAAGSGRAVVIDCDTIDVAGERIRLWGIDAPESRQTCVSDREPYACGQMATDHLRTLIGQRELDCAPRTKDRYGRTVAVCRLEGIDLGAVMVKDGWALAFVRYSRDYVGEENDARQARRGMWSGAFALPWEWRANRLAPLK